MQFCKHHKPSLWLIYRETADVDPLWHFVLVFEKRTLTLTSEGKWVNGKHSEENVNENDIRCAN